MSKEYCLIKQVLADLIVFFFQIVSSPIDTVSSPIDTVSSPIDSVSSPIDTVGSPIDKVSWIKPNGRY